MRTPAVEDTAQAPPRPVIPLNIQLAVILWTPLNLRSQEALTIQDRNVISGNHGYLRNGLKGFYGQTSRLVGSIRNSRWNSDPLRDLCGRCEVLKGS